MESGESEDGIGTEYAMESAANTRLGMPVDKEADTSSQVSRSTCSTLVAPYMEVNKIVFDTEEENGTQKVNVS